MEPVKRDTHKKEKPKKDTKWRIKFKDKSRNERRVKPKSNSGIPGYGACKKGYHKGCFGNPGRVVFEPFNWREGLPASQKTWKPKKKKVRKKNA